MKLISSIDCAKIAARTLAGDIKTRFLTGLCSVLRALACGDTLGSQLMAQAQKQLVLLEISLCSHFLLLRIPYLARIARFLETLSPERNLPGDAAKFTPNGKQPRPLHCIDLPVLKTMNLLMTLLPAKQLNLPNQKCRAHRWIKVFPGRGKVLASGVACLLILGASELKAQQPKNNDVTASQETRNSHPADETLPTTAKNNSSFLMQLRSLPGKALGFVWHRDAKPSPRQSFVVAGKVIAYDRLAQLPSNTETAQLQPLVVRIQQRINGREDSDYIKVLYHIGINEAPSPQKLFEAKSLWRFTLNRNKRCDSTLGKMDSSKRAHGVVRTSRLIFVEATERLPSNLDLPCYEMLPLNYSLIANGERTETKAPASQQDDNEVFVQSWKSGDSTVPEQLVTLNLEKDVPVYELNLDDNSKVRHFRLRLQHIVTSTLRTDALPCWSAVFTEITKDSVGVETQGHNLLSSEGPGVGDYFPRDNMAAFFCPIEKPGSSLDGQMYDMKATRTYSIERFFLSLRVSDYLVNRQENKMEKFVLEITFKNK